MLLGIAMSWGELYGPSEETLIEVVIQPVTVVSVILRDCFYSIKSTVCKRSHSLWIRASGQHIPDDISRPHFKFLCYK